MFIKTGEDKSSEKSTPATTEFMDEKKLRFEEINMELQTRPRKNLLSKYLGLYM